MSAHLTKDIVLIQSFETAAISNAPKKGALRIPAAANRADILAASDSIFRTTEK